MVLKYDPEIDDANMELCIINLKSIFMMQSPRIHHAAYYYVIL